MKTESGQALLITLLLVVLLLITIPILISLNQAGGHHSVSSIKNQKGRSTAEAGIAYAERTITNAVISQEIQNLVSGQTCSDTVNPWNFDGSTLFPVSPGSSDNFSILCTPGPETYQWTLLAVPRQVSGETSVLVPGSSVKAVISPRTLGAKMSTIFSVPAALEIGTASDFTGGNLNVFFGPVTCFDAQNEWVLDTFSDTQRYPRKFSAAGIRGTTPLRSPGSGNSPTPAQTTDSREYWAFAGLGRETIINNGDTTPGAIDGYVALAKNTSISIGTTGNQQDIVCNDTTNHPPSNPCAGPTTPNFLNGTQQSGYFGPSNLFTTPAFLGQTIPFKSAAAQNVIYIDTGVVVNGGGMGIDLWDPVTLTGGALIITGDLLIQGTPGGSDALTGTTPVRVPPTAYLEFPYGPSPWPCMSQMDVATTASSCQAQNVLGAGTPVHLRGFLYVKGNLILNSDFNMIGALRVDGSISFSNNATLRFAYDDQIQRNIRVSPFEVQIDSYTAVTGPNGQ